MLLVLALCLPQDALAWGQHYSVSDRALNHPRVDYADELVTVETLEEFLIVEADGVAAVLDGYYDWLEARGSTRFERQKFDTAVPTVEAFMRATRLNPETSFPLAYRVPPGRDRLGTPTTAEQVSKYLAHVKEPLTREVDLLAEGQQVPARAVLTTFADEPDWGFDHHLWGYTEYGYGEQPYGEADGESSKAAFHMQFAHEHFLIRMAAPKVLEGMVIDRMELFLRLARYAFESDHPYWGYRFAAWATHYAQDLCQPYHAKAVPSATGPFYLRYALSPNKDRLEAESLQLSKNRHFLHEDYVAYSLQQSYLRDDAQYQDLAAFLASGELTWAGVATVEELAVAIMAESAAHSRTIDKSIVKAFGSKLTEDVTFDVERSPEYSVIDALANMDPKPASKLLVETGEDFDRAGRATRTIVAMARGE